MISVDTTAGVAITLPGDSLTTSPTLSATEYANPESLSPYPAARQLISPVISLEANGTTPVSPVSITMKLNRAPVNPSAYYWDPAAASWSTAGLVNGT